MSMINWFILLMKELNTILCDRSFSDYINSESHSLLFHDLSIRTLDLAMNTKSLIQQEETRHLIDYSAHFATYWPIKTLYY